MIYRLQILQERLSTSIESFKERYYARIANRLNNTQKSTKTYWSLLKIFLNNKKLLLSAYTTIIPPSLNSNKAHGHDKISIRMLKICGYTICKPLELNFNQVRTTGVFLSEWKKGNIAPRYKKGNKQNLINYRPVSLLPICGKVFERLIFNKMFSFFLANNLLSSNQSAFKPGDSCINQVLSITHEIYSSFDDGFEVRSVLLDISKAFDKV